jgi:hypothetical protein
VNPSHRIPLASFCRVCTASPHPNPLPHSTLRTSHLPLPMMSRPDSYSFPASSSSNPYRYSTYEDQRPLHEHEHHDPDRSGPRGPPQVHPLYHDGPEDHDEAFDVRADFDGDGPRWSERYGSGTGTGHSRGDSKR